MPYIKQEDRAQIDVILAPVLLNLHEPDDHTWGSYGSLNYIITKCITAIDPQGYSEINAIIGVLECAKLELYRRIAAPYEDVKARTNGDVYPPMKVYIDSSH